MSQNHQEKKTEPCGCAEITTYDVAGKVVAQDLDHCIAHALEWAGSFLTHAGRKLLDSVTPKETQQFSAVYADGGGKRLWQEAPYMYPVPHKAGEVLLHEDKGFRVVKSLQAGQVYLFTVEECDPCDATVVRDAVVDHLKKHGLKEPTEADDKPES